MDYVYRFAYVEPALHPRDEADLILEVKFFDVLLDFVCRYFIEDFALMFIRDVDLNFLFHCIFARFGYQDDADL